MKAIIVGPGAIGCLFAGLLTEAGNDVWLLDRNPERAAEISEAGILIEGIGGSRRIQVRIESDPTSLPQSDFVIICVKSYDTIEAIRRARPAIDKCRYLVSIQNGLGNIEHIAEVYPDKDLIAGITSQGSTTLGAGHIRHAGTGMTLFSNACGRKDGADELSGIMNRGGLTSGTHPDFNSILWGKAVLSAGVNPVSAIYGVTNGELIARPDLKELALRTVAEAARVAGAMRVSLPYPRPAMELERLCTLTAANRSSMLQDIAERRKTEIDSINGYIARMGSQYGIPVPTNEMLITRVKAKEA